MRKLVWLAGALLFLFARFDNAIVFAQTETDLVARMGMRSAATYHYSQVFQMRGRWLAPDIIYIDFARNNYRELSAGGGAILFRSKHFTIIEEGYLIQATGPAAHGALYLMPWTFVGYKISPKISGETVYFLYIPIKETGRIQHVLERTKVEYNFEHFKVGAGYGAYQFGDKDWQHKPFLTTTLKGGELGNLELWLQLLPGNHVQAQIRYRYSFTSKKGTN